jgi:DNA modification methylase
MSFRNSDRYVHNEVWRKGSNNSDEPVVRALTPRTPFVQDSDFQLYVGDVREQLRQLPDESVHCVVTSPPYWGLRMYLEDGHESKHHELGLEPTPEQYVANMVDVFREVRRVLRRDGTCWMNLGDSYATTVTSDRHFTQPTGPDGTPATKHPPQFGGQKTAVSGLKPKDLCGIPWRVAFALQADGWYLRSDIVWSKPNPMPESVTDRPTKAHEYVFLLTRSPRYFFDADAVREDGAGRLDLGRMKRPEARMGEGGRWANDNGYRTEAGRNIRSVWEIATQPYPEAHFATFPEALPERCIRAGTSERGCCPECGAPWERVTLVSYEPTTRTPAPNKGHIGAFQERAANMTRDGFIPNREKQTETTGWNPTCNCAESAIRALGPSAFREPVPCTVLDPFMGSGTTALVARRLGRRSIGVELNESYAALCARRLQQLSLFAGATDG